MNTSRADLARNTLGVLFIGILILASAWILQPFVAAIIWATIASNAGDHGTLLEMNFADFVRLVQPRRAEIAYRH